MSLKSDQKKILIQELFKLKFYFDDYFQVALWKVSLLGVVRVGNNRGFFSAAERITQVGCCSPFCGGISPNRWRLLGGFFVNVRIRQELTDA